MDLGQSSRKTEGPVGLRWYVVQTKPGKESVAIRNLANQRLRVFSPWTSRTKRIGSRSLQVKCAFFPSYLFVQFDSDEFAWRSINGTLGVRQLVAMGEEPAPLPCGFVEHLIGSCDEDGELAFSEELACGDRVRIVGGAFDRLCGKLLTSEPRERVLVLLETFTRTTIARERRHLK